MHKGAHIYIHGASPQSSRDSDRALVVFGVDGRGQTVAAVVREGDCLVFCLEPGDDYDGTEDFFLDDLDERE